MPIHDDFFIAATDYAVDLDRFAVGVNRRMRGIFKELETELVAELEDLRNGGRTDAARFSRANRMRERVEKTIGSSYTEGRGFLRTQLVDVGSFAQDSTIGILNNVIGGSVSTTSLVPQDIRSIASNIIVDGQTQREWWSGQEARTKRGFIRQVRLGLTAGETNDEIVRRVRGTATGKTIKITDSKGKTRRVREFKNGVMNVTTRDAETLVRTSVQSVSNDVLLKTYEDNSDLVQGVDAVITFDNRTTPICISRDGAAWDLATGKPLPGSSRDEAFPGPPPWHPRCRTTLAPRTKSWEDIIAESTGKRVKLFQDELTPKSRAALGGPVAGNLTYDGFLQKKSKRARQEILGVAKEKLWAEKKITLAQLTDNSGRPLTVAELRKKRNLVRRVPKK